MICSKVKRGVWISQKRDRSVERSTYRRRPGRDFRNPPPAAASTSAPRSAPLGLVASSGALRAFLAASIGQVPRILDAEPAAATCRHHALLERGEGAGGAVIAVVAAVLDAPGPVDSAAAGWASIASAADASTANATRVMIMAVLVNSPRRFEHLVRIVVPARSGAAATPRSPQPPLPVVISKGTYAGGRKCRDLCCAEVWPPPCR